MSVDADRLNIHLLYGNDCFTFPAPLLGSNPALTVASCVTLDKLFSCPVPQFPLLQKEIVAPTSQNYYKD
jgi:hypothetical protein